MRVGMVTAINNNNNQNSNFGNKTKTIAGITVPVSEVLIKPKSKVLLVATAVSGGISGLLFELKQAYLFHSGKILDCDSKTEDGVNYDYDENGKLEHLHKLAKDDCGQAVVQDVEFYDNGLVKYTSTKTFSPEVLKFNNGNFNETTVSYRKDGTRSSVEETKGKIIDKDGLSILEKSSESEIVNFKNDGISVDSFASLKAYYLNGQQRTVGFIKEADDKTVRQDVENCCDNLINNIT